MQDLAPGFSHSNQTPENTPSGRAQLKFTSEGEIFAVETMYCLFNILFIQGYLGVSTTKGDSELFGPEGYFSTVKLIC